MGLREGFFLFFFLFYSCFFYVGTASRQFLLSRTVIFSEILGIRKVSIFIFYIILFSFTCFVIVSLGTRSNGDFWWDGILKIQRLVFLFFLSFFSFFIVVFFLGTAPGRFLVSGIMIFGEIQGTRKVSIFIFFLIFFYSFFF